MGGEKAAQRHGCALIEKDLHGRGCQASTRLRWACSSTASTCARVTPGNHSRNCSTVAPLSRFSNSAFTGTRVPLNSQTPLTFPGIRSTAAHCDQLSMPDQCRRKVPDASHSSSQHGPPSVSSSAVGYGLKRPLARSRFKRRERFLVESSCCDRRRPRAPSLGHPFVPPSRDCRAVSGARSCPRSRAPSQTRSQSPDEPLLIPANKLVLPHSQDAPTEGSQRAGDKKVAGLIGRDFLPPERRVGLGPGGVLGAAVPKAACPAKPRAKLGRRRRRRALERRKIARVCGRAVSHADNFSRAETENFADSRSSISVLVLNGRWRRLVSTRSQGDSPRLHGHA